MQITISREEEFSYNKGKPWTFGHTALNLFDDWPIFYATKAEAVDAAIKFLQWYKNSETGQRPEELIPEEKLL